MARTVGNKIASFLSDIYPLLENFVKTLNPEHSNDLDNEIVETCFSIFETLIKKCPKEVGPLAEKILNLSVPKLAYDPNFSYDNDDDEQMDDGDEGEGWDNSFDSMHEEDDDSSWKVRRSAIKTIDAIISSRHELLRLVYREYALSIVDRFKERDDNVKCNILEAF